MKKRAFLAMMAAAVIVSACGGTSQPETTETQEKTKEPEQILDLSGNWEQANKSSEDSFQAGYIKDDVIELYWITDNGDTKSLYWSGTYVAPTESSNEYTWDSENNKEKTESAMMASGDDTKTFTYKDGELSYSASALGTTTTIRMERTETNYQ